MTPLQLLDWTRSQPDAWGCTDYDGPCDLFFRFWDGLDPWVQHGILWCLVLCLVVRLFVKNPEERKE